jgi:AraC family transcriptional regulator, regulatory protein of adaptative response / methylated-DNA-[protein]-cysteine methyltransferase
MPNSIRYAWGQSSLGSFMVAVSDLGLVAFEFAEDRAALIEALRRRFPDVVLEEDGAALSDTVEKLARVVDCPGGDPGLALDPQGTKYEKQVWNVLREIPAGHTTTYGAIAAQLGSPRDARDVTEAIAANPIAILIPCHRVVKKDGSVAGYRWAFKRKKTLLAREQSGETLQGGNRSA